MRILVLNHEFPPVGGGGGRAAESICRVLAARGHEILVLTSHMKGQPRDEHRDGYRIVRIPALRIQPYRASLPSMLAYVLAGVWAGSGLIRVFQPDLIHVHFAVPAGALAWFLSKRTRIPYVLTAHLGDVPGGVPEKTRDWFRWIFPFTRFVWREASARVAVSEFTRGLALRHYNEEILVIPNGVDVNLVGTVPIQVNDPPVIVFAGRFVEQKSPQRVVEVLRRIKDLPWKCVMIGDGPLLADVKRSIAKFGLQNRIELTGWIAPDEVMNRFERSDILFMPSLSEGLPVVGVQALSKGLAIVASHVGGFLDLVEDGQNGYLVPVGDVTGYSVRLQELLKNRSHLLSLRKNALQKAKSFEITHIAAQYETLFQGILRERQGSIHMKGNK